MSMSTCAYWLPQRDILSEGCFTHTPALRVFLTVAEYGTQADFRFEAPSPVDSSNEPRRRPHQPSGRAGVWVWAGSVVAAILTSSGFSVTNSMSQDDVCVCVCVCVCGGAFSDTLNACCG